MLYCVLSVFAVDGVSRVVRQCSGVTEENYRDKCVERLGTKGVRINYCHCGYQKTDACNGAYGVLSSPRAATVGLAAALPLAIAALALH